MSSFAPIVQLLGKILDADAFRNGDAPGDGQRLVRGRQARRRNEALHRAFLHPTGNVALAGATGRTSGRAPGRDGPVGGSPGPTPNGRAPAGGLARGMHRPAFAGTQRRTPRRACRAGDVEKLAQPGTGRPGTGRGVAPAACTGGTGRGGARKPDEAQSAASSYAARASADGPTLEDEPQSAPRGRGETIAHGCPPGEEVVAAEEEVVATEEEFLVAAVTALAGRCAASHGPCR